MVRLSPPKFAGTAPLATSTNATRVEVQPIHDDEENAMNRFRTAGIATVLALSTGGVMLASAGGAAGGTKLRADLVDVNGASVGKARLTFDDGRGEVEVRIKVSPSMAGFHGFHIHSVGKCEAPFTTAGSHLGEDAGRPDPPAPQPRGRPPRCYSSTARATPKPSSTRTASSSPTCSTRTVPPSSSMPRRTTTRNIPATDATTGAPRYSNPNAVNPPVYPNTVTDAATSATGDSGGARFCGVIH